MTYREAIEIVLAGRRAARRSGQTFTPDVERLKVFGLDASKVSLHVARIEAFVEKELAAADGACGDAAKEAK